MAIPDKDLRILLQRSGNRCAFTDCRELLTAPASPGDAVAVLGHVAHIIGQSRRGPRGDGTLEASARDAYANLILMCTRHHKLVDSQPQTYTAPVLEGMKEAHERWVETTLGHGVPSNSASRPLVTERLHSNLLSVERLPEFVFSAPCEQSAAEIAKGTKWPAPPLIAPWTLSGGRLYSFQDLHDAGGPFAELVERPATERHRLADWFDEPDSTNRFLAMANRGLISLARRRGLQYDHSHKRFFFSPKELGSERSTSYKSMTGRTATRRVVYQPRSKKHGTAMSIWVHWAVRLRLVQIAADDFVVSFTPDLRITKDGEQELAPKLVGEKVTRRKTRWYNFETLSHVHFWRDYISQGKPRIVLPFSAGSSMVINSTLIQANVSWPGIPAEFAKSFTNVDYEEDLFSLMEQRLYGEVVDPAAEVEAEDYDEE